MNRWRTLTLAVTVAVSLVLTLLLSSVTSTAPRVHVLASPPWPQSGVDYVSPASTFTGCANWHWLQPGCYENTTLTPLHVSPKSQLTADIAFIRAHNLGMQRVWVSLDELFSCWDSTSGYCGYDQAALANVDDVINQFAAAGVPIVLVLFTNSNQNGFHPEALDGNHAVMRASYLLALHDFLAHVSQDSGIGDVAAMDLLNEAYYQLEHYFNSADRLGTFTQCATAGISTACVDTQIIHPWLMDLYTTAKAAAPRIAYTISDTGRLLGTNQAQWVGMYPVDLYDIHAYNDNPGASAALYATARALPKPWIAGEVGCAVGNTACTYNGVGTLAVDSWWLDNLPADGARSVLVEDRHAVWSYSQVGSVEVAALSAVGQVASYLNSAVATATPTPSPTATESPTPTPTLLPWHPQVQLPHGSPHGPITAVYWLYQGTTPIAFYTKITNN